MDGKTGGEGGCWGPGDWLVVEITVVEREGEL